MNTAVYQLRKALSAHGFREMVISAQELYGLDLDQVDVDFIRFEQGVEGLSVIEASNEAAAMELEKQYAGVLFEDKSYEWATAERERLTLVYDSLATRLASWLLDRKRYGDALQVARTMVSRNEFNEESNYLLLQIVGSIGDLESLHKHYQRYAQLLLQELGLRPSPRIQQQYERFQSQ